MVIRVCIGILFIKISIEWPPVRVSTVSSIIICYCILGTILLSQITTAYDECKNCNVFLYGSVTLLGHNSKNNSFLSTSM